MPETPDGGFVLNCKPPDIIRLLRIKHEPISKRTAEEQPEMDNANRLHREDRPTPPSLLRCQCDHGIHFYPPQGPDGHEDEPVERLVRADNGLMICPVCERAGHGFSLGSA